MYLKRLKYQIFILAALLFITTSCNDLLDESPDERLSIDNLQKIEATIVGGYQNSRGFAFTHMSSDDVTLVQNIYSMESIIEDLYSWKRKIRNETHQDSPSMFWVAAYGAISQVNHALEAFDTLPEEVKSTPKAKAIKGEALVLRSYYHFMLVNIFSKHYDPATANQDLGVPYVFVPERTLIEKYQRETVEKVYQLAEKDLIDGITLLEEDKGVVNKNKFRFTMPTAYNYASRFYTWRNKDQEDVILAVEFGEKAITAYGGLNSMRPWSDYLSDYNGFMDASKPDVGLLQSSATWMSNPFTYQCTNYLREAVYKRNPFGFNDDRFKIWFNSPGDVFVPAFYFEKQTYTLDLFPLSEAIFNTAEGYVRLEQYDAAKSLMEVIGQNVYSNYDPIKLIDQTLQSFFRKDDLAEAWIRYILFERRNQFLFKGMRWFDIKRHDLHVKHIMADGKAVWLNQVAPNRDYQIPSFAIKDGLQPNK